MIVLPKDEQEKSLMLAWCNRFIPVSAFDERTHVLGVMHDDQFAGCIAFSHFTGPDARISLCIRDKYAFSRASVEAVMSYAFDYLKLRRLTAMIKISNRRARKLAEQIGFKMEGKHRKVTLDGCDALLYGLLKEECRYVRARTVVPAANTQLH